MRGDFGRARPRAQPPRPPDLTEIFRPAWPAEKNARAVYPLTFRLRQYRQPVEAVGGRGVPGAARGSCDVEGSLVQRLRLRELSLRQEMPRCAEEYAEQYAGEMRKNTCVCMGTRVGSLGLHFQGL